MIYWYYYLLDKNRVDFKIDFSEIERCLVDKINLHRRTPLLIPLNCWSVRNGQVQSTIARMD